MTQYSESTSAPDSENVLTAVGVPWVRTVVCPSWLVAQIAKTNTRQIDNRCTRRLLQDLTPSSHKRTLLAPTYLYFKRGSVPPRCTLGSAVFPEFFLRNGSN